MAIRIQQILLLLTVMLLLVGCGVIDSSSNSGNTVDRSVYPGGTLPPSSSQGAPITSTGAISPSIVLTPYYIIRDSEGLIVNLSVMTTTPTFTMTVGSNVRFINPPIYSSNADWQVTVDEIFLQLSSPLDRVDITSGTWHAKEVDTVEMRL